MKPSYIICVFYFVVAASNRKDAKNLTLGQTPFCRPGGVQMKIV